MDLMRSDGLSYYQFDSFRDSDVVHGIFTREGGISDGPYKSLNVSVSTGDEPERVRSNVERVVRAAQRDPATLADLWQVHSADVVTVLEPNGRRDCQAKADAMITDRASVTLVLRFADCVPILLWAPRQRAVGLVHAGWRGSLNRIAATAVRAMGEQFKARPQDIRAGIGPSIGPECYEVGPDVVGQVAEAFRPSGDVLGPVNGRQHLDLWALNRRVLLEAGVESIEVSGICTACNTNRFFSHRAEGRVTGRFGALIALR